MLKKLSQRRSSKKRFVDLFLILFIIAFASNAAFSEDESVTVGVHIQDNCFHSPTWKGYLVYMQVYCSSTGRCELCDPPYYCCVFPIESAHDTLKVPCFSGCKYYFWAVSEFLTSPQGPPCSESWVKTGNITCGNYYELDTLFFKCSGDCIDCGDPCP